MDLPCFSPKGPVNVESPPITLSLICCRRVCRSSASSISAPVAACWWGVCSGSILLNLITAKDNIRKMSWCKIRRQSVSIFSPRWWLKARRQNNGWYWNPSKQQTESRLLLNDRFEFNVCGSPWTGSLISLRIPCRRTVAWLTVGNTSSTDPHMEAPIYSKHAHVDRSTATKTDSSIIITGVLLEMI